MLMLGDAIDLDLLRLRNEFLAMPGLVINGPQVARLLGVRLQRALELLDALQREGLVIRMTSGSYRRAYPMSARSS